MVVVQLPTTPSGKVQKFHLREIIAERTAAEEPGSRGQRPRRMTGRGEEEGANTDSRIIFSVPAQPMRRPGRSFPILGRLIGAFGGDFR